MAQPSQPGKPSRRGNAPDPAERANTLGLNGAALNGLLNLLENAGQAMPGKHKREFVRWPIRQPSVVLKVIHPGGTTATLRVACRNLSCGGAGLLHSAYIHPGSKCVLQLPNQTGGSIDAVGRVARCKHVVRMIHELGVRFDSTIDVRQFMAADDTAEAFSREHVNPDDLRGCVLLVDDAALQHKLVSHHLEGTQLRLRVEETVGRALEVATEGCDLIVTEYHLPDGTGSDLIRKLRDTGITTPVVVSTGDDTNATRDKLKAIRPDGILIKPVPREKLLRAIAEFVGVGEKDEPAAGKDASKPSAWARDHLAGELRAYGPKLRTALICQDAMACFVLCKQVRGSAPAVGLETLGARAGRVADALSGTMNVADVAAELEEIAKVCENLRPPRAA